MNIRMTAVIVIPIVSFLGDIFFHYPGPMRILKLGISMLYCYVYVYYIIFLVGNESSLGQQVYNEMNVDHKFTVKL